MTFPYFIEYKSFIEFLKENFEVIFTCYLILKQDKSKLMQIYNLVNDSEMKNEDEMIVGCVRIYFLKILSFFFNSYLEKNVEFL